MSPNTARIPRTQSSRGAVLVEALVATLIFVLLVATLIAGLRTMAVGASRQVIDTGMGFDARRSVDEMLTQMRYASGVVASCKTGDRIYTTGNSTVVLKAAGYDPATTGIVLPSVTDYIILEYDAKEKEVRETTVPGAGSKRIPRSNYVIAKNVEGLVLTYRVRDQFVQTVTGLVPPLSAKPSGPPLLTVDGEASVATWVLNAVGQLHLSLGAGSKVQAIYPVSATDVLALPFVRQVDVEVKFANTDSHSGVRKLSMSGTACLRNRRSL